MPEAEWLTGEIAAALRAGDPGLADALLRVLTVIDPRRAREVRYMTLAGIEIRKAGVRPRG